MAKLFIIECATADKFCVRYLLPFRINAIECYVDVFFNNLVK